MSEIRSCDLGILIVQPTIGMGMAATQVRRTTCSTGSRSAPSTDRPPTAGSPRAAEWQVSPARACGRAMLRRCRALQSGRKDAHASRYESTGDGIGQVIRSPTLGAGSRRSALRIPWSRPGECRRHRIGKCSGTTIEVLHDGPHAGRTVICLRSPEGS